MGGWMRHFILALAISMFLGAFAINFAKLSTSYVKFVLPASTATLGHCAKEILTQTSTNKRPIVLMSIRIGLKGIKRKNGIIQLGIIPLKYLKIIFY